MGNLESSGITVDRRIDGGFICPSCGFLEKQRDACHVGNKEKGGSAHGKGSATAEW